MNATVQVERIGLHPQSRSHVALRILTRDERERIAERLRDLDELAGLLREKPYAGRWGW